MNEHQREYRSRGDANPRSTAGAKKGAAALRSALFEGRYEEAFQTARALRDRDGENTASGILYAGACALFGLGHILQAEEWVEAHGERTKYRAEHLYLAAYIELHKERADRALLYWTRIVQDDPSQTFADALIEKLKRGEQRVRSELNQPGAFLRYVPLEALDVMPGAASAAQQSAPSRRSGGFARWLRGRQPAGEDRNRDAFWWLLAGIVVLSTLSIGFGAYLEDILGFFAPDPYSAAHEDLPDVPLGGAVIRPGAYSDDPPRFVYPDKAAALAEYREAREKIGAGYPNQARYLLGRLELSNASFEIKERALLLRDAIPRVRAADFRDPLDVASVLEEPYIYRDAQINWYGTVANPRQTDAGAGFDLIVSRGGRTDDVATGGDSRSNPSPRSDVQENGDDEADSSASPSEDRPGVVPVSILFMPDRANRTELPDLSAGQSVRVFGAIVKSSGGRITVHASEIE